MFAVSVPAQIALAVQSMSSTLPPDESGSIYKPSDGAMPSDIQRDLAFMHAKLISTLELVLHNLTARWSRSIDRWGEKGLIHPTQFDRAGT